MNIGVKSVIFGIIPIVFFIGYIFNDFTKEKLNLDHKFLQREDSKKVISTDSTQDVGAGGSVIKPHDSSVSSLMESDNSNNIVDRLTRELEMKLAYPPHEEHPFYRGCYEERSKGNSCNGTCLRMDINPDLRTRVAEITEPEHLKIKPQHQQILSEMRSKVKGQYDIVIITAANARYFGYMQTLMKSLHNDVYPFIKNFTVILYDLGLTKDQRRLTEKYCRCQVLDFPFNKVDNYFRNARCYTFKPLVITAHFGQGNVLVWLDASVTFPKGGELFSAWLRGARKRGIALTPYEDWEEDEASRTLPSMYHFFGEEACAYLKLGELQATLAVFGNQEFVKKLILDPWVACAFERSCMCPHPYPQLIMTASVKMANEWKAGRAPMKYGLCHRFDQSALNILVMKLYRERYRTVCTKHEWFSRIAKRVATKYFPIN